MKRWNSLSMNHEMIERRMIYRLIYPVPLLMDEVVFVEATFVRTQVDYMMDYLSLMVKMVAKQATPMKHQP